MVKERGFTLAEVLIVLAIIGVVAALTIPTLMASYQKTQQVTALKKVYSQLSEAIDRVMTDSNAGDFKDVTLLNGQNADPKDFFLQYFKVAKYCDKSNSESCFPTVSSMDKSGSGNPGLGRDCIITQEGASICIYVFENGNAPTSVLIDTNGLAKPNMAGRDVFTLDIYHDGSVDDVIPESRNEDTSQNKNEFNRKNRQNDCFNGNVYGGGCFSKIFDAGWKMDY